MQKVEKKTKFSTSETRQKVEQYDFSLRGKKRFLYIFEQSKSTLILKNKIYTPSKNEEQSRSTEEW